MTNLRPDTSRPSLARMYDYTLGGTRNFEVDQQAVERIREMIPELSAAVWANRGFVQRAAKWIAEQGVRQFVDIGAGLPTMNNTHDVVRAIHPDATVVYVDYDSEVVAHGLELLGDNPGTAYLHYDLRDPSILDDPVLRATIDFTEPIGLLVVGVLDFLPDAQDPRGIMRALQEKLPSGSYFAASHGTADKQDPAVVQRVIDVFAEAPDPLCFRTLAEFERFFDGLEMQPPYDGAEARATYIGLWGADDPEAAHDETSRWWYAGIARKP